MQTGGNSIRRHTRVSLITVGPGERVWEALGHVCVRVTDSTRHDEYRDIVFNYGTFDYEQGFEKKMIKGELLYSLTAFPYDFFRKNFVEKERSLSEQEFLLTDEEKTRLINNLVNNALPPNKYYRYNFFVDNCSTRIYYMIRKTFGNHFRFGITLPPDEKVSYYDLCQQYYGNRHWERVGVSLFFADRMNMAVTNEAAMFLPAFLSRGLSTSLLDRRPFCAPGVALSRDSFTRERRLDMPMVISIVLAILAFGGLFTPRLAKITSIFVPVFTGLIGLAMAYAWFGTRHTGCENNLNLLWALPFGIVFPLLRGKARVGYALAALVLLFVVLVLLALHLHAMPVPETAPLLLSLALVYAGTLKRGGA